MDTVWLVYTRFPEECQSYLRFVCTTKARALTEAALEEKDGKFAYVVSHELLT